MVLVFWEEAVRENKVRNENCRKRSLQSLGDFKNACTLSENFMLAVLNFKVYKMDLSE